MYDISIDNSTFINACHITNSVSNDLLFTHIPECNIDFYKDNLYNLSFNIYGQPNDPTITPEVVVLLSGSAFNNDRIDNKYNGGFVGKIKCTDSNTPVFYRNLTFDIVPDNTGEAALQFFIHSGDWKISDISIIPVKENGFTSENVKFLIPLDPNWDGDKLDIKLELYNYVGDLCNQLFYIENVTFSNGKAYYLQGVNNLITGSVFLGKTIGSGIEMSGKHSGIVMSSNYMGRNYALNENGNGVAGWILWSGSFQLVNSSSGFDEPTYPTNYSGVGLELQAAYDPLTKNGRKPHSLRFDTVSGILSISGSLRSTDAVFENYAIADFLGSRVITIDQNNYQDYYKTYLWSDGISTLKPYTFLNLAIEANASESATFCRIVRQPDFPISNILCPTIEGIPDNSIATDITFEFNYDINPYNTYFSDVLSYDNQYFLPYSGSNPQISDLGVSNAIRNFSGSFVYSGYKNSATIGGYTYNNLLKGKKGNRYVFKKGSNGFGIISMDAYDEAIVNYKDCNILNLYGNRRNEYYSCNSCTTDFLEFGEGTFELFSGSIDSIKFEGDIDNKIGPLFQTIFVPEFIVNTSSSIFHYFGYDNPTGGTKTISIISQSYSIIRQTLATETTITMDSYTLPDKVIGGLNNVNNVYTNAAIKMPNLSSGNIIYYKFYLQYQNIGHIYMIGQRFVFDRDTNIGRFSSVEEQPSSPPST